MEQIKVKNIDFNEQLLEDGFGIIPSFLPAPVINALSDFFDDTLVESKVDVGFFTTHWSPELTYRKKINDFVQQSCLPFLQGFFDNYKCGLGYFLYKQASAESEIGIHRDWTLIDESKFRGYIIWIPLTDTNVENGCFHLVPRSHLACNEHRGSHIQPILNAELASNMIPVPIKAGSALVIDLRLLHYSPPNLSIAGRLAVGLLIVPTEAPLLHYYYDSKSRTTQIHKVDDNFLINSFYDYKHQLSDDYILSFINK